MHFVFPAWGWVVEPGFELCKSSSRDQVSGDIRPTRIISTIPVLQCMPCQVYGRMMDVVAVVPNSRSLKPFRLVVEKNSDIDACELAKSFETMRSCLRRDSLDLFRYDVLERITTLILNVAYMVASSEKGLMHPGLIDHCRDAFQTAAAFRELLENNMTHADALASPTFPVVQDAVDQIVDWTDSCFETVDNMWVCSAFAIRLHSIRKHSGRPSRDVMSIRHGRARTLWCPARGSFPLPPVPGGTGGRPEVAPGLPQYTSFGIGCSRASALPGDGTPRRAERLGGEAATQDLAG